MRRLALVALTVLLLAGCNGGGSDDPKDPDKGGSTSEPTPSVTAGPKGPDCAGIWKDGATLPEDYKTCVLDGAIATQEVYKCLDGTKLVAFNDAMYAVTGGKIHKPKTQPFQDTEDYGKVYSACTGE